MRNTWAILFCACLLVTLCKPSQAAYASQWTSKVTVLVEDNQQRLLGSHTFVYSGTVQTEVPMSRPMLTFALTPEGLWGKPLFEDVPLLSNVGQTIWVSSNADDANYNTVVQRLTDGRSDTLYGFFTLVSPDELVCGKSTHVGGGEDKSKESSFLGNGHPDFAGMTIGRIGLRIDAASVALESVTVPEPGTIVSLLCLITGAGGLALKKRRG